jgi:hypothetical protein
MNDDLTSWGHVNDQGAVEIYRTREQAERNGPVESLCYRADDGSWIYAGTGQPVHPFPAGLSPATASSQMWGLLGFLNRHGFVQSVTTRPRGDEHLVTSVMLRKDPRHDVERLAQVVVDRASEELPRYVNATVRGTDDEAWNYVMIEVLRARR